MKGAGDLESKFVVWAVCVFAPHAYLRSARHSVLVGLNESEKHSDVVGIWLCKQIVLQELFLTSAMLVFFF